jgi:Helix-turn-helix domain
MATVIGNSDLWTRAEVATLFGVAPKTVTCWAEAGRLSSAGTVAGHQRFHASEIRELFDTGVFSNGEWAGIVDVRETPTRIIDIRAHPRG